MLTLPRTAALLATTLMGAGLGAAQVPVAAAATTSTAAATSSALPTPRTATRNLSHRTAPAPATGTPTLAAPAPTPPVRSTTMSSGGDFGAFLHMSAPTYAGIGKASQIVLQQHEFAQIPAIHAANPSAKIYFYANASAASAAASNGSYQPSVITYPQLQAHPEWALRTATGATARWKDYTYLRPFDLGNPALAALAVTTIRAELTAHDWDGVMLDDVNSDLTGHDWTGAPVNLTGGSVYAATHSFLKVVGPAVRSTGKEVAINMQSAWNSWKPQATGWSPLVDVVNLEHCTSWTEPTGLKPASAFLSTLDAQWRLDEMTAIQSAGARVWCHDYGTADDVRTQAYSRAMFLISWDGRSKSASMWTPSPWQTSYLNAASTLDLGAPLAAASRPQPSLYRRAFAQGTLLLNTATVSTTVTDAKGTVTIPALSSIVR